MDVVTKPCTDKPPQCDRQTAFMLFSAIQKKVQNALLDIQNTINRSRALKRYPYPMTYKKTLTRNSTGTSNTAVSSCEVANTSSMPMHDESSAMTDKSASTGALMRVNSGGNKIRNTIDERISETLENIRFEQEAMNIDIVSMVVDACLRYQIAVRNLVELGKYLSKLFDRFHGTHIVYDGILSAMESSTTDYQLETDALTPPTLPNTAQIAEVQNNLEISKETLQKFLNQVPSQLGKLRIEIDLMAIYDNVDDTVKVHRFLNNKYVKTLVGQGVCPALKRAYDSIHHAWEQLLPADF